MPHKRYVLAALGPESRNWRSDSWQAARQAQPDSRASLFRRGVWGTLGGSKPSQEEPSSTAVEGTAPEAGQAGTSTAQSAPKTVPSGNTGAAWGGAGLPARIQVGQRSLVK